ncbi:MAG TPA: ferritin-like domain-containing protein [Acidimicrobiales bacterium]
MDPTKSDEFPGAITRRRVLGAAGLSVAAAAVLAACGDDGESSIPVAGIAPTTTGLPERTTNDAVLLRTASSLEHLIISVHDGVPAPAGEGAEAFALIKANHAQQAKAFETATRQAGGEPFTEPNPVIKRNVVDPTLAVIKDNGNKPEDVLAFLHGLEEYAAGTYQSFVTLLTKPTLRQVLMGVGAASARQAAVAAGAMSNGEVALGVNAGTPATTTSSSGDDAAAVVPVYQVPGTFGALGQVSVVIGTEELVWDLPGPNSYMYDS